MTGLDYNERVVNEMQNIPLSYWYVDNKHPSYSAPLHWHRAMEVVHVLSGKLTVNLDGDEREVAPGDILFINREVIHSFTPSECVYEIINFDTEEIMINTLLCKDELSLFTNKNITVRQISKDDENIYQTAIKLFKNASVNNKKYSLIVLGNLYEFLGIIYEKKHYIEEYKSRASINEFKVFFEFIEKNYMENIRLEDMAKSLNMSVSYFSILFHRTFNQTPVDYLNSYRVERAGWLLQNSDLSITEVARGCGFNDGAYFTKVFKKYKMLSPKQYRNLNSIK